MQCFNCQCLFLILLTLYTCLSVTSSTFLISIGQDCPRAAKIRDGICTTPCTPSTGCTESNSDCLCDSQCGYSCVSKGKTLWNTMCSQTLNPTGVLCACARQIKAPIVLYMTTMSAFSSFHWRSVLWPRTNGKKCRFNFNWDKFQWHCGTQMSTWLYHEWGWCKEVHR